MIERKRYYQSKDYVPETTAEAAKKKTVAKPKEDKNANDTKKSKVNKKNNQSQLLTDNYNLISSDDKVLASFNMNVLAGVLDGSSKEVEQNFSIKLRTAENGRNGEVPSTAVSGNFFHVFYMYHLFFDTCKHECCFKNQRRLLNDYTWVAFVVDA